MHSGDDILDLKGRTAFITGAGRGVGRQVAMHMASHGAGAIVVNDFNIDRAVNVAAEVEALGVRALPLQGDVSDYKAVAQLFDKATEELGGVDILVNNAGNAGSSGGADIDPPFWTQQRGDWDKYLAVNIEGVLNCSRHALPGMVEKRYGRIVTVISDAGRVGEPGLEIYSAAKAAAAGFTRAIARSVGRYMITANCVALAATRTPFVAAALADEDAARAQLKRYIVRRFGEPEDAANMILFLASDAASWITAQTYPVNGGYSVAL
jgi:3-oxoacyl-[acyl-carrier protein] reductase